ncbi:dihydrofolate reductase family protein [Nocardia asteroides]|uniref:dihydrofolate reductase family protein n=1 Tax=Nocardia asteroides TaxID=1824 RepID=UPI001E511AF7|nr:dihydrofolate reductase [Nocardia asteroides]UGT59504.1 dihydrofolate reductase [Nocardia asteroides]
MPELVYFVGVSLDGYIAGPDGEIDFFPLGPDFVEWLGADYPETLPAHVHPHFGIAPGTPNRHFGSVVMGRATYQPGLDAGFPSPYPHLTQYVVSTTLTAAPAPDVRVVTDPKALVRELKATEERDIWLAGGGRLAAALLDEIDALVIKRYPVLAGAGIPVCAGEFRPTRWAPVHRRSFENGTQVSTFRRAG